MYGQLTMSAELVVFNKKPLERVNLNQYRTVYKSPLLGVFTVGVYFVYRIRKLTVLLARSDINVGNSLYVPQLTAVRCHYPVFLFMS